MSQIGKSDIIRAIFAAENLTGILLTQRMMDLPQPPAVFRDFWTLAYQASGD
jgi:hypothetical protein